MSQRLAYHFDPALVDHGEGSVTDEVLGGVLVDAHRVHGGPGHDGGVGGA